MYAVIRIGDASDLIPSLDELLSIYRIKQSAAVLLQNEMARRRALDQGAYKSLRDRVELVRYVLYEHQDIEWKNLLVEWRKIKYYKKSVTLSGVLGEIDGVMKSGIDFVVLAEHYKNGNCSRVFLNDPTYGENHSMQTLIAVTGATKHGHFYMKMVFLAAYSAL